VVFLHPKKNPDVGSIGVLFSSSQCKQRGKVSMPEIIAVILQKVEVIMEKYGFWKVTGVFLLVNNSY